MAGAVMLGLLLGGSSVLAAGGPESVFTGGGVDKGLDVLEKEVDDAGVLTEKSLIKVILNWVKFALAFLAVFAFVSFIWAGALYITAFMNEENAESAKKIMIWSAIGIVIILLSYALTNVLISANVNG